MSKVKRKRPHVIPDTIQGWYRKFEQDFTDCFQAWAEGDNETRGAALWSALANVDWRHKDMQNPDMCVAYSFRSAGALIADKIFGTGCYMDWYCSGPYASVNERIATSLRHRGWSYRTLGSED